MSKGARENGIVSIETAILLPVFLLLVLGVIEFSRLLWTRAMLTHACHETARYAMVRGKDADYPATEAQLRQKFVDSTRGIDSESLTLQITPDWDTLSVAGQTFRVTAQYTFPALWDVLPAPTLKIVVYTQASLSP